MRMYRRLVIAATFASLVLAAPFALAKYDKDEIKKLEPDAKVVSLIEGLVKAIQTPDVKARAKAVAGYCHESMMKGGELRKNYQAILRMKARKVAGVKKIEGVEAERRTATGDPHRFGQFTTKAIDIYKFTGADGKKLAVTIVWDGGAPKAISFPN